VYGRGEGLRRQFDEGCCSVLHCGAVCCSVLQCVAVCCSVLQCVAVCCKECVRMWRGSERVCVCECV